MSYQTQGVIRSYDGPSDSCTVEFSGIGNIDTWLSGIKIEAPINRAQLINGAVCTLTMPDANRICEAKIISLTGAPTPAVNTNTSGTGVPPVQSGSVIVNLSPGSGIASVHIDFNPPFPSVPTVYASTIAQAGPLTITNVFTTGCDLNLTGGPHGLVGVTIAWQAQV